MSEQNTSQEELDTLTQMAQTIESLEEKIATLEEKNTEAEENRLRAIAELQNAQRRQSEALAQRGDMSVGMFLQKLLPKFLELRLGAENSSDEEVKKTIENFWTALAKEDVTSILPKTGDVIDPELHEVLMAAEGEPGTVVQIFEPGWKYKDRIIAPAKVSGAAQN